MRYCLYNSLTKEAKAMSLTYLKDYELIVNSEPEVIAPFINKTIMRLTTLDGKATATSLWASLRELTQYAIKENGNILSFILLFFVIVSKPPYSIQNRSTGQ